MTQCCQTNAGATAEKRADVTYRPDMDIIDLGAAYEIRLDIPGATRDEIGVTLDEGVLTIEAPVASRVPEGVTPLHAEYGVGAYRRRVRLGEDIDRERLEATYELGVLTLTLPKRAEVGPKRIAINGA
ncbi:MAG: Hsp20/alpha crystallin family protein [Phycisphaerales bacterium]